MIENNKKQVNEFLRCISKLTPVEFIGLAKIMNVSMVVDKGSNRGVEPEEVSGEQIDTGCDSCRIEYEDEDGAPAMENSDKPQYKDSQVIIEEMVDKFVSWNRMKRRNLMKILRSAAKRDNK